MVIEPAALDYIDGDDSSLEIDVLERLSDEGRLGAYQHDGFWQPMDTQRDMRQLQAMWDSGEAPWSMAWR